MTPASGAGARRPTRDDPKRVSLREQQKLFTRQRLIDGALEVFERQGYAQTTVDDIAAAAGGSRATFYLHFPSKLELFRELAQALLPEVGAYYDDLDRALAERDRQGLRDWLDRAFAWFESHRTFVSVLAEVRVLEREDELAAFAQAALLADALTRFLKTVPKRDRERTRLRLTLLHNELPLMLELSTTGRFALDREAVIDEVTDLWAASLLRDGP